MGYTDQDVERVAEAIKRAAVDADGTYPMGTGRFYAAQARAALEVMEREPLENVIHDLNPGTKIVRIWPLRKGGYEAEIGVPVTEHPDGWWDHERFVGEGATIDEAIRAAVASANEGYAMIDTGRREPGEGGMK